VPSGTLRAFLRWLTARIDGMRIRARIAVTGSIASGKSTIVRMMEECGLRTASADDVARDVFSDPKIQHEISLALGVPEPLERGALRALISDDPAARRTLNRVTHPEIVQRIAAIDADVLEIPLLFESCLFGAFDRIWLAWCEPDVQLARLTERTGDVELAKGLIRTQVPLPAKVVFADVVVRTNFPLANVHDYVSKMLSV